MKIIRKNTWRTYPEHAGQNVKWSFWNEVIPFGKETICFNTRSGAVVVLDKEEYLQYEKQVGTFPGVLTELGITVAEHLDEKQEWCAEYKQSKKDWSFLDLTIVLTFQCQFKCIYCFEGEKRNEMLTDETFTAIQSFLEKRAGTFHKLHVTWFGGEPLLEMNRIRQLSAFILEFCKKHGIFYYADITTNGYALNPSKCKTLVEECNVKRYMVTVDGVGDVHNQRRPLTNGRGTFDVIWENIATLLRFGAAVTIRVTIDKTNADNIKNLIDRIAASNIAGKVGLVFVRTIDYSFTPDKVKKTIYTAEEFAGKEMEFIQYAHSKGILHYSIPAPCPLGGCLRDGDVVIGPGGEIYKCLDTVGDKRWITRSLTDSIENTNADWYQEWLDWEPSDSPDCKICKLQPLCNGGCPHNALFTSKKHGTSTQCPDWSLNYKENIQLYVTEKLKTHEYQEV